MGGSSRVEELHLTPASCAVIEVDSADLHRTASALSRIARHLARHDWPLQRAAEELQRAGQVPGGFLSAAPARAALGAGRNHLRRVHDQVQALAQALRTAAREYEESEGLTTRLLRGVSEGAEQWRGLYGTWLPSPRQFLMAPLSRYYAAGAQAQLASLPRLPARAGPLGGGVLATILAAGTVYHHQLTALSPTGWYTYSRDLFRTGRLLPKALSPLLGSRYEGVDRQEGAELATSLSGVMVPGGGVGEAGALAASGVWAVHGALGHRSIRMSRLEPREEDLRPNRRPVRSFAGAIEVMAELEVSGDTRPGELRIDKVTSDEGEHSWQVFIPGGQGFSPANVHSLIHTVASVDGKATPSVAMVASALREVGAVKGEPIMMIGHSHGGITGSMFANDPRLRAEFDVPLVVTAGSPVDRHEIRPDTHVVSIEHTEDFVTGLDGVAKRNKPGLTRIERTLADSADPNIAAGRGVVHSHDYPSYINTAGLVDAHPDTAHLRGYVEGIIPEGKVETFRFRAEITR